MSSHMTFVVTLLTTLLCLSITTPVVQGDQILRIVTPDSLVQQFPNGSIAERSALFGFPRYGGSITGFLTYAPENATACNGLPAVDPSQAFETIYVVDRGDCTFVTKVRAAQKAGARAVIVVDSVQETLPFMADDGTGRDIEIPSVLIGFTDGTKIKSALSFGKVVEVLMTWSLPNPDDRVEMDLWTSSVVRDSTFSTFKKNFVSVAKALGSRLLVEPHFYIINGTGICTRAGLPCGDQCVMAGKYCAPDPESDRTKGLTGGHVVKESLRQLCVWNYLNTTSSTELWWEFTEQFEIYCSVNEKTYGDSCVNTILTGLKIDPAVIVKCMTDAGGVDGNGFNTLLDNQIKLAVDHGLLMIPSLSINGVPYRGSMYCPAPVSQDHCGVFQAVCAGYVEDQRPAACIPGCDLAHVDHCTTDPPLDPPVDPSSYSSSKGVSVGTVVGIVIAALVVAAGVTYFFVRRQQRRMREDLDSILQSYMPIDGNGNRTKRGVRDEDNTINNDDHQLQPATSDNIRPDERL